MSEADMSEVKMLPMSRLILDDQGFELTSDSGERVGTVQWSAIAHITAIQRPTMEPDEVCLDFEIGEQTVTVSELDTGFEELVGALYPQLDIEYPNWYAEAIKPSIQLKPVLVYDREAGY